MTGRQSRGDNQQSAFGYVVMHLYFFGQKDWPGGSVSRETEEVIQLFRNCTDDGSWPAVHALQRERTNVPKLLCSKSKILSVGVKRCRKAAGACTGAE